MTFDHLEDHEVVRHVQQGTPEAFDELVRRYQNRLYRFGRRVCRNTEDAKDMLQETLIGAFRGLHGFRGGAKFSVWLYQIAKHACMRLQRKSAFEPEHMMSIEALSPDDREKQTLAFADWRHTPVQALLNAELRGVLDETLHAMPPDYRLVFQLRDVEGFSVAETAQILECSDAAVKTRLHRARLFARKQLHAYYQGKRRDA